MHFLWIILFGLWLGIVTQIAGITIDTPLYWLIIIPANLFFVYLSNDNHE